MKKVCVHDGSFHADDVFAVAILKLVFGEVEVFRSRDPEVWKECDFRVDIGDKYSFKTKDFDHHQEDSPVRGEEFLNVPYASCGLIWKHYGMKLVNSEEAFNVIEKKIIVPIDADDNGVDLYKNSDYHPYTLTQLVSSYQPSWDERNKDFDVCFLEAVDFAMDVLRREINRANGLKKIEKIVKKAIAKADGSEIVVLDKFAPWKSVILDYSDVKFVVYKGTSGKWHSQGVPIEKGSFRIKVEFPSEWAGLKDDDLVKVSGVKGAYFCHKSLFLIVAATKKEVIDMTKIALERNSNS